MQSRLEKRFPSCAWPPDKRHYRLAAVNGADLASSRAINHREPTGHYWKMKNKRETAGTTGPPAWAR